MSDGFSINKKILNGFVTGLISAYLFNPFDKALYLVVKNKTHMFNKEIWKSPFKGVCQTLYNRVIGYGIYFSAYDIFKQYYGFNNIVSGALAGTITALFNNPIHVVKMYNWNTSDKKSFIILSTDIYRKYGLGRFYYGLSYTTFKDVLFSCIFFALSEKYNKDKLILYNIIFASLATIITSPVYYFRNRIYFDFNNPVKLKDMIIELQSQLVTTNQNKIVYLFHNKFNIVFLTLRTSIGLAVSKKIYDCIDNRLST